MFKTIRNKVMSTLSNLKKKAVEVKPESLELEKVEVEFLLKTIAESKFEGRDVQLVYETAVKLQTYLISL